MAHGRYGIDAPRLVFGFLSVGLALSVFAFALLRWVSKPWVQWVTGLLFGVAAYTLFMCAYMLWGSLVVKVRGRDAILNLISWTGREEVLDVGCGRGLLLIGAANRLTNGTAVGIDLWIQKDQGSNTQAATLENATLENVADRVRVETGDMRRLRFANDCFDVVLSSWAVHNIEEKRDRENVLIEMVRVLKPGGSILLNDIVNRAEYEESFKALGLTNVRVVIASKWSDTFSGVISFGSFRPATVVGSKRRRDDR